MKSFRPSDYQPKLTTRQFCVPSTPSHDTVEMDVVFVGGGPAGLAGAIELAKLTQQDDTLKGIEIGVLEKSDELGQQCLSGAIINPVAFRELFPELSDKEFPFRTKVNRERVYLLSKSNTVRIPTPPTMNNKGNYVASICEIVRFLGAKAEQLGVNLFTGFPADALLTDGNRIKGVRTTEGGLTKDGKPSPSYLPPTDVLAQVTVLSEGVRGHLTQSYLDQQSIKSPNPQIFALGVKELWEVKRPLDAVIHTLGWPLPRTAFGGSFAYPMSDNLVSIGVVVGLDYKEASLDIHHLLQNLKQHPLFQPYLQSGELLEWGAKTIPEGGFHSLPRKLHGDGILLVGDGAGFVDVPSLKGIHYAMKSGMLAAHSIYKALKKNDTSAAELKNYDKAIKKSFIKKDLHRTRNMRLSFKSGFFVGGLKASAMTLTGGLAFSNKIDIEEDARESKIVTPESEFIPDGTQTFSKQDAVFRSGNNTRDSIPSHLSINSNIPLEVTKFYEKMCPAAVYEHHDGKFVINHSNCIDCKTTDVLGPRWRPREGGSGTKYKRM